MHILILEYVFRIWIHKWSIAGDVVSVVMGFLPLSTSALEINVITNLWDVFAGCSLNSSAASQMYSVLIVMVITNNNEIASEAHDFAVKDTKVIFLFTQSLTGELGLHDVHIVSIASAVGNAEDLGPHWGEDSEFMDLDCFSWEPGSDVGVGLISEHFFQIGFESIIIGFLISLSAASVEVVAGVVMIVDGSFDAYNIGL